MFVNPDPDVIKALLQRAKSIAMVGLSPQPKRPSHGVARHMQQFGYRVVPVRPLVQEVLGEKAYSCLAELPFPVDIVNVFRAAEHIPQLVEECIQIECPVIWIQQGIIHEQAARRANQAGLIVVMDRCIYRDYLELMI
ncbi:CoA-binding protein [Sulfuriferula sp. GW1]|uniref:CoA-binding protein n=1 Tax=Sulfuriferula sp. GW1 TaxID=3345111 RepID=UPI0039AFD986